MNRVSICCILISYLLANNRRSCSSWTTASICLLLRNLSLWLKYLLILWNVNSSAAIHRVVHCSAFIEGILSVHVEWVLVGRVSSDVCLASIWLKLLACSSCKSHALGATNWIVVWNYTSTDHSQSTGVFTLPWRLLLLNQIIIILLCLSNTHRSLDLDNLLSYQASISFHGAHGKLRKIMNVLSVLI